jgi:hypothetical protein
VTSVADTPFQTTVYKLGDKYLAARSNEFGYANYEIKYWDLGSMAAVDRRSAVLSTHGVRLSGRLAWYVWLVVHITFMTGFKNRFTALINWFLSFVGKGRLERAIVVDLNRLLTLDLKAPKVGR